MCVTFDGVVPYGLLYFTALAARGLRRRILELSVRVVMRLNGWGVADTHVFRRIKQIIAINMFVSLKAVSLLRREPSYLIVGVCSLVAAVLARLLMLRSRRRPCLCPGQALARVVVAATVAGRQGQRHNGDGEPTGADKFVKMPEADRKRYVGNRLFPAVLKLVDGNEPKAVRVTKLLLWSKELAAPEKQWALVRDIRFGAAQVRQVVARLGTMPPPGIAGAGQPLAEPTVEPLSGPSLGARKSLICPRLFPLAKRRKEIHRKSIAAVVIAHAPTHSSKRMSITSGAA